MQAYANVATLPVRKVSQQTNKVYWEFRAAESAKGDDKNPTWYTVRIFKDEDPALEKGDFVVFTGKLKQDVFMARDGKPMGVLTVMAFQLAKVEKSGKRKEVLRNEARGAVVTETATQSAAAPTGGHARRAAESIAQVAVPEPRLAECGLPVIDLRLLPM